MVHGYIGACRSISGHCPGYFESCVLTLREPDAKTPYLAYVCLCTHRRTYSVQCRDKIHFPQLCIKCGVAKFCPGTHTALQAPMHGYNFVAGRSHLLHAIVGCTLNSCSCTQFHGGCGSCTNIPNEGVYIDG